MYWHGRLVIPALQRFCASQQVARIRSVSISSPSGEGGEKEKFPSLELKFPIIEVSISSPSGEGGEVNKV
jgi:hypothetical protein